MTVLPTYFAAESSAQGIGALGFNPQVFLIQLTTFILAYLVLRRFAFGPILKVLDKRRETIEKGVNLGEEMQKERAQLESQVREQLRDARKEADEIVAQAHDAARERTRKAEEQARAKADGIVAEAQERIQHEARQVRRELEKELVGLVSDATETIIDEKVDAKKDAALIDRALKGQARA